MSWTQADLETVTQVKRDLLEGKRVTEFTANGRTFKYQQISLEKIERLEREIRRALSPKKPRRVQIQYEKT